VHVDREQWSRLEAWLDDRVDGAGGRQAIVFDGDGTLWADDLGERHLAVLEAAGHVSPSDGHDSLLAEYGARCELDVDAGYSWAVQCMAGLSEEVVVRTSRVAWEAHRHLVPGPIRALLAWCDSSGLERWVVSASHRWAVSEATADLGFPRSQVLAMAVDVESGVLTSRLETPVPNGPGKVDLIEAHMGARPWLAVGNSRHDLEMLRHADRALVVRIAAEDGVMPEICGELQALGPNAYKDGFTLRAGR
jgi:phosphoserine phosphatase